MFKQIALTFFAIVGITTTTNAQLAHEIGVIFGPVTFQSDYGQRHDFSTNVGNAGFVIGVIHYLNFSSGSYGGYFN